MLCQYCKTGLLDRPRSMTLRHASINKLDFQLLFSEHLYYSWLFIHSKFIHSLCARYDWNFKSRTHFPERASNLSGLFHHMLELSLSEFLHSYDFSFAAQFTVPITTGLLITLLWAPCLNHCHASSVPNISHWTFLVLGVTQPRRTNLLAFASTTAGLSILRSTTLVMPV